MIWKPDYKNPSQEQLDLLCRDEYDLIQWQFQLRSRNKHVPADNIGNWIEIKRKQIEWMKYELDKKKKSRVRVFPGKRLMNIR